MSGLICSGNVRLAYVDDAGTPTGNFIGILNAVKLALNKPAPDVKQRASKQIDSYGEALGEVDFPKPTECSLTVDDVGDAEILGWALGGTSAGYTQASATGSTATLSVVTLDQWLNVGKRSLSNVTVKDSTDTATYGAGTDYILDATAGFIQILSTGAITAGVDVHVTYDCAALTGDQISVGTRQSIQVRIEGDMKNLDTGLPIHVVVPKAKLAPTGELDFMGSDYLVAALSGTALSISGAAPATVTRLDA